MTRPAVLLAALLIALVLLPAVVAALVHPGDTTTYELGAAATSADRLPDGFSDFVARRHDRTPPTMPATTTTRPPSKRRQGGATTMRPATGDTYAVGEMSGIPYGGDLPPRFVLERESMMTDDPLRVWNDQLNSDGGAIGCYYEFGHAGANPCGSTASGPWQILRSTWDWFGGYLNAADAPLHVQVEKVRQLWAGGAGCSHWRACRG